MMRFVSCLVYSLILGCLASFQQAWAKRESAPDVVAKDLPIAEGKADTISIDKIPDKKPESLETFLSTEKKTVDFLLKNQNKDGSWGDHRVIGTWNILCPYPDGPLTFRTASTALCIVGLNACSRRDEPQVVKAMERAEDFLVKVMPRLKRGHELCIYNIWAHTYVLDAMCMRASYLGDKHPRYALLKKCAADQIEMLEKTASARPGGWGYLSYTGYSVRPATEPTSFLTASVLISAKMAEDCFGLKLSDKVFSRALRFLKGQRTPAGTYVYSLSHEFYPGRPINRHTGSLSRTPSCDYAIELWSPDDISMRQFVDGLDRLWSRIGWVTMSLHKPKPHESFAQNSGYFFYYGYYYVGMSLHILPKEFIARHAAMLGNDIIARQCTDGSWWDYPLYNYHKFYGTGYALYALAKAREALYPPSAAESEK